MAQTGQSEAIHSPAECAKTVVRLMMLAALDRRALHGSDLMLAQGLAYDLEPAGEWRIAERPLDSTATGCLDEYKSMTERKMSRVCRRCLVLWNSDAHEWQRMFEFLGA
jgi:hypothetical protein